MSRNDFKELFAYILLGLVWMTITFWVVTQIEHKEKTTRIESRCKP